MTVFYSELNLPLIARGKVRDIYEAGPDGLLLVASDRLSAFDVVFEDAIPRKGEVLNQLSAWWFHETSHLVPNHLISSHPENEWADLQNQPGIHGRASLCRKATPLPVECVVRGYLEGSAWKDYVAGGTVSGVVLPPGLARRQKLDHPIFTPSSKAESGHDEPISFEEVVRLTGVEVAEKIRHLSLLLYTFAHERLLPKDIILCDTKFEFGIFGEDVILIDEILTPDSSRFWEAASYSAGAEPHSLDKQYVRDYVESIGWDKKPPAPRLPEEIIRGMSERYLQIFERITGHSLDKGKS